MSITAAPQTSRLQASRRSQSRLVTTVLALLAGAGLLAEQGFYSPPVSVSYCRMVQAVAVLLCLSLRVGLATREAGGLRGLSRNLLEMVLLPLAAIAGAVMGVSPVPVAIKAGAIYVVARQAAVLTQVLLKRLMHAAVAPRSRWQPVRLVIGTYLLLIVLGGALLAVPAATLSDHRNAPYTHTLNSLFMATSAVTATGLGIYDVSTEYTLFGRTVLLLLMQLGGLAALIFGTLFGLHVARSFWPQARMLEPWDIARARRIVRWIVLVTLGIEAHGVGLMWSLWAHQPTVFDRAFSAVFHAVSAFCNVGFTLYKDNLVGMGAARSIYTIMLPIMVLGGLGAPVLYEIGWRMKRIIRSSAGTSPALPVGSVGWSLHTRLVLAATLCLLAAGTLGLLFFETPWQHAGFWHTSRGDLLHQDESLQTSPQWMVSHEAPQRTLDALFQSASARTAGFKTVLIKTGAISPASLVLLMMLMLVGGSPASTAGGLHTISLVILGLAVTSILRRRKQTSVGGAVIPPGVVRCVLAISLLMMGWLAFAILALAHTQRADFLVVVFEAVSALTTSGLSLGLTPYLALVGKIVLLLSMLLGRIGLLVLMLAMADSDTEPRSQISQPLMVA